MTREKAFALISAHPDAPAYQIIDLHEEAVYRQATFFLNRPFVVKQAQLKIRALEELAEAAKALRLGIDKDADVILPARAEIPTTPDALLRSYHEDEKVLKRALANTSNPETASSALRMWLERYERFGFQFTKALEAVFPDIPMQENVRLTEQIDFVLVLSELSKVPAEWNEVLKLYTVLQKQVVSA